MTLPPPASTPAREHEILDSIPTPVYVWRRVEDGSIRLAGLNAAALAAAQGSPGVVIGIDLESFLSDSPEVVALIEQTLADGEPRRVEHEYRMRGTNELRWRCMSYMRSASGDVVVHSEDTTTRRLAEARLQESEARFRGVFEQGLVAMSIAGLDGRFLEVNQAFCTLLGYSEADLLATTFMALTHPDDVAADVERKGMLASGAIESHHMEKRYFHADGRTIWADLSARLVRDANGAPRYLLAQMQDITARKSAEALHARERLRMAELLERAPALIATLRGPTHVCEMANLLGRSFFGGRKVLGRPLAEAMPELVEQGIVRALDRVLRTGEPHIGHALPVQFAATDGGPPVQHYMNLVYQAIEEVDGTRSGVFVHGVDVTALVHAAREHERLLAELHASQERHDLVLKATNDLIYDWDMVTDSCFFSDTLFTTLGHPSDAARTELSWWKEQIHPDDLPAISASLSETIGAGAQFWESQYRFRRGDGSYATILDRGHIIRAGDGAAMRMIGSMADVTERRLLEARLRESQKMEAVGRLAGGVAHDFNNLLCAILGYTDLALMDARESADVSDELTEIRKAAQRAAQLTKQLLAFGRRQIRRPTHVDVNAVVRDTDRLLTQLLGEHIQLITNPAAAHATVHMDPSELDQILVNLTVNARDAMPHGGAVSIETSRAWLPASGDGVRGDCVLLTVADSGSGIDPETLPHIFEPFFTTKGDGGTGLGLSTVYGIVQQNGGRIEVESIVGEGTRFQVYLPAATGAPTEESVPIRASTTPARGSATVLLAEDENGVRTLARRILERAGFTVLEARHGADALMLWREHADEVDVVVTDLVMPEMGGRTLAELLRRSRPELPVLFMSGYSDDEVTRHGFADSRIAFLAKPFTAESLVGAVRATISRPT